ncbi:hypothetical protein K7957_16065 [Sphingomonas yunnanensis]|uniref:hypothetical protein n=1 Tax=Sphingomonas yunnanensis TaxID=310400 RepID=UPI001CA69718|nr:hypothetical protein [Sphingomonas yunnanensis]MBY9064454.1 hypothetical protein [Sphingomonas yunnanensis]
MTGTLPPTLMIRCLLAELLAGVVAALTPVLGARVERVLIYLLLLRRTLDGGRPTPVLGVGETLAMPFETARRHVAALAATGRCRRVAGGMITAGRPLEDIALWPSLALVHDRTVALIERLAAAALLPELTAMSGPYDWVQGLRVTADLALATAAADQSRCPKPLDRVLLAALLAGNAATFVADLALRRATAPPQQNAPAWQPVRRRLVAAALHLPEATVRRRFNGLDAAVEVTAAGLVLRADWLGDAAGEAVGADLHAALRRHLAQLARYQFPLDAPATAYRRGTPAPLDFG